MKPYKFSVGCLGAEQMWEFSMANQVIFHFIEKIEDPDLDPVEAALKRLYVYEGFMDPETYLMFRLAIPAATVYE